MRPCGPLMVRFTFLADERERANMLREMEEAEHVTLRFDNCDVRAPASVARAWVELAEFSPGRAG